MLKSCMLLSGCSLQWTAFYHCTVIYMKCSRGSLVPTHVSADLILLYLYRIALCSRFSASVNTCGDKCNQCYCFWLADGTNSSLTSLHISLLCVHILVSSTVYSGFTQAFHKLNWWRITITLMKVQFCDVHFLFKYSYSVALICRYFQCGTSKYIYTNNVQNMFINTVNRVLSCAILRLSMSVLIF